MAEIGKLPIRVEFPAWFAEFLFMNIAFLDQGICIAPVIAPSAAHRKIGAFPMQWGFNHPTKGMLGFNTRSETATLELKNETAKGAILHQHQRPALPDSGLLLL